MAHPVNEDLIKHWHSFKNPLINDILINLEKLEVDVPPMKDEELSAVKKLLDYCLKLKPDEADIPKLIDIFNQMPAPYMLYMIHKLQSLHTDLIMKIINYAQSQKDKNPEIAKFFQRNMVFEKSQLLGRIFSTARMENVLGVL